MKFTLVAIFGILYVSYCSAQYCNPVINVNSNDSGDDNATVSVKTEIQVEQTRELFKNVSEELLNEYEKRFEAFVSTLNVSRRPMDCQDVYDQGSTQTGIYKIYPHGTRGFLVRCDMSTNSGGWTVIQRRISSSDFYKTWNEYQTGFGNLSENFWLGNQQIHFITSQGWYELRVDMKKSENDTAYAAYNVFTVGDVDSRYKLNVEGYHGDAGDSLWPHNGYRFSTKDRDNDAYRGNCASLYNGAWWYKSCHNSNLNGVYGRTTYGKGINWDSYSGLRQSLIETEMKVRRWMPQSEAVSVSVSSGD